MTDALTQAEIDELLRDASELDIFNDTKPKSFKRNTIVPSKYNNYDVMSCELTYDSVIPIKPDNRDDADITYKCSECNNIMKKITVFRGGRSSNVYGAYCPICDYYVGSIKSKL